MGAKTSKGSFNRQAEARQSQKKSYQKFRQTIAKLTKEVNKVKIQNKEKLLELEIAIKSATNDLEIAKTYTEPNFAGVFNDFLKKCGELDKIVKEKLEENDKNLEEIQRPKSPQSTDVIVEEDQANLDQENAMFAEDFLRPDATEDKKKDKKSKKKDKSKNKDNAADDIDVNSVTTEQAEESAAPPKKHKKKKAKEPKQAEDTISSNTLDLDEPDKPRTSKNRFWSFPMRLKRKPSTTASIPPDALIIIQDLENEDRSLQNIEINQLEKAIKTKRRSKAQSQFFDDVPPPTPSSTPVEQPVIRQQDSLQQIHNIRMSITTLEEMTKIYRLANRGNYDYIYDNLNLCVNKLKDLEQEPNLGILTLRHEKKLAMQHAQECLDVLEGKIEMPERFQQQQEDERSSRSFPQVVIARTPSKRRENCQKSVEFIDITNNDEVIEFSVEGSKESHENAVRSLSKDFEKLSRDDSSDLSEDDDLTDILMSLKDSTEEIAQEKTEPTKPLLITSF